MLRPSASTATGEELASFYRDLESYSTAALWTVQEQALVDEPKSKALPHVWRWSDLAASSHAGGGVGGDSKTPSAG